MGAHDRVHLITKALEAPSFRVLEKLLTKTPISPSGAFSSEYITNIPEPCSVNSCFEIGDQAGRRVQPLFLWSDSAGRPRVGPRPWFAASQVPSNLRSVEEILPFPGFFGPDDAGYTEIISKRYILRTWRCQGLTPACLYRFRYGERSASRTDSVSLAN